MPSKLTNTDQRLSTADLPPDLKAKYLEMKAKTENNRGLDGPPVPEIDRTESAPFYFVLRAFVKQLKNARELAGLTVPQLAERTGLAAEMLTQLEAGTLTNPSWKTLGSYAAAVDRKPSLIAESLH
jgi:DNA-binding XRE family transcriptional regulator